MYNNANINNNNNNNNKVYKLVTETTLQPELLVYMHDPW